MKTFFRLCAVGALALLPALSALAAPGDLDPLDADIAGGFLVYATVEQPDGKLILAGNFTSVLGVARQSIARLNADGTLDAGFDPKANAAIRCVAVQPDGKIVLGGEFTTLQPNGAAVATSRKYVARVNADGTLDTGFDPQPSSFVYVVALQADGRMVLGGNFTSFNPNGAGLITARDFIARVNGDGSLDTVFNPNTDGQVFSAAVQADGRVLLGGTFSELRPNGAGPTTRSNVARVNADGTLDSGFSPGPNGAVYGVAQQPNGQVLLCGIFTTVAATARQRIARVNADGALDPGFDPRANSTVTTVTVQADGKVLLGGSFTTLQPNGAASSTARQKVARVNANGTLDAGFDPMADFNVHSLGVQADGRVLIGGNFTTLQPNGAASPTARLRFARLLNDPATQVLSAANPARVVWSHSGAGPSVTRVTFELSTDGGVNWVALGAGTRVGTTQVWERTGLTLPATGLLRACGTTLGGYSIGSSGLIEQVAAFGFTAGAVDPLNPSVVGTVFSTAVQPDGKVILAGAFTSVLGVARQNLARLNADGTLDPVFDPRPNGQLLAVAVQGDGKVLVAGGFSTLHPNGAGSPVSRSQLARLNADGTLDIGFDPKPNTSVLCLAVQPDGKVLLGGTFTTLQPNGAASPTARFNLARVNADGTLDAGFNPRPNSNVNSLAVQLDGKVLIGGFFTTLQPNGAATPTTRNRIARVQADGTLDAAFDPNADDGVNCLAVQADRRIVFGGRFNALQPAGAATPTARSRVARLHTDGTLDAAFDPSANDDILSLAVQTDGKVLLAGVFTTLQPNGAATATARNFIARVHPDGTLDAAFDPKADFAVRNVALQADGRVLLSGSFSSLQPNGVGAPTARAGFARLLNDPATQSLTVPTPGQVIWSRGGAGPELARASYELSTNGGASWTPLATPARIGSTPSWQHTGLALPSSGLIRARGVTTAGIRNGSAGLLEQVASFGFTPGNLDPLNANIAAGGQVLSVAVQPDGKFILAGSFTSVLGVARQHIARLNADGTLDTGFDPKPDAAVNAVAVQDDGKILLGGSFTALQPNGAVSPLARQRIARVNADGTLDAGFDPKPNGGVITLAVQADGKVLLGGGFTTLQPNGTASPTTRRNLARVNADGTLDPVFDPSPESSVFVVAVQPDGKVLLGGFFNAVQPNGAASSTARLRVARVHADGTLDTGFDPRANSTVYSFAVQPDGKVLLGGFFTTLQPNGAASPTARERIARLNADGTIDTSFDPRANSYVIALAVQADGKVLVGGGFGSLQPNGAASPTTRQRIARVNADGTLDTGFDPRANGDIYALALAADGKVLLGGTFTTLQPNGAPSPVARPLFARLFNDPATQTLSAPATTQALWTRGGAAPELTRATFELSTDGGASWLPLGEGTRLGATAHWQRTGLVLPLGGLLRARGATASGYSNGSAGQLAQVSTFLVAPGELDALDPAIAGPFPYVTATAVQPDGKTILGGRFTSVLGVPRLNLARLHADGKLDLGFDPNPNGEIIGLAVQPDGKVLLCGFFSGLQPNGAASPTTRQRIARVNADGSLDAGFDPRANGFVFGIAVQPDGRIVLGGGFTELQPNGAATPTTRQNIARVNADGTLDTGFDPRATSVVNCVTVQPDGKVLLGGTFTALQPNGAAMPTTRQRIARVNADGTLDPGFNPAANGEVSCVALQADGRVLLGGQFSTLQPNGAASPTARLRIARVNADGTLDPAFDPSVMTTGGPFPYVSSVAIQADGKVLFGGDFTFLQPNGAVQAVARNRIARVHADGTLDTAFNPNADGIVYGIALQADGQVLLGGLFSTLHPGGAPTPVARARFARLLNDPATQFLTAPDTTQARWTRSGAGPELTRAIFELSTNGGASWTPLGEGSRIGATAHWQRTGLALPVGGALRARGATSGGYFNGTSGLIEQVAAFNRDSDADGLLDSWELLHFPSLASQSALDDFDRDGVVALLELAFGLNPLLPDAASLPAATNEAGFLSLTITRRPGVNYEVQSAGTLLAAQPDSFSPATTTILINNTTTLKVRDNILIGTPPGRFVRVKVTAAP